MKNAWPITDQHRLATILHPKMKNFDICPDQKDQSITALEVEVEKYRNDNFLDHQGKKRESFLFVSSVFHAVEEQIVVPLIIFDRSSRAARDDVQRRDKSETLALPSLPRMVSNRSFLFRSMARRLRTNRFR